MIFNITQNALTIGESINWLSTLIGITGALFGIYIWFYDRKNMKKATLYFPLFLACSDIIKVIENPEDLGEKQCRKLLENSAKTLDEIVYSHGSVIHLKRAEDLQKFISIKKVMDQRLDFIKNIHPDILKETLESDDFKDMKNNAETLLKICKEEVKEFRDLKE
jgi:predicted membrane channel-forming protein YqfA (hemolysin III family)